MSVNRRTFLLNTAATAGATVLATGALGSPGALAVPGRAVASGASAAPGGFPDYKYVKTLLDPANLKYNPTGEIIFPCVRGVYDKLSEPLGRYYLYYAPHDRPGGICLAYGDSLEGPFTEYPENPIVSNVWEPHYNVSHVSSPHVMWNPEHSELWLYFHGENTTTRLARSKDGISFDYDKAVLTTEMLPDAAETSYARVFPYEFPDRDAHFVMMFMRATKSENRRDICWGWSADGRDWEFAQEPLVRPHDVGAENIAAPALLERDGKAFVVYHADKESGGDMHISEVAPDFASSKHLGVFYNSGSAAPENGRAASASFGNADGVPYMVYEAGERLAGVIAVARG